MDIKNNVRLVVAKAENTIGAVAPLTGMLKPVYKLEWWNNYCVYLYKPRVVNR